MRVAFTGHRPEQLHIGHNELSEEGQALRDFIRNEIRVLERILFSVVQQEALTSYAGSLSCRKNKHIRS